MDIDTIKAQIRMIQELLEKPAYQNDGMKKHLKEMQDKLKELEDVKV